MQSPKVLRILWVLEENERDYSAMQASRGKARMLTENLSRGADGAAVPMVDCSGNVLEAIQRLAEADYDAVIAPAYASAHELHIDEFATVVREVGASASIFYYRGAIAAKGGHGALVEKRLVERRAQLEAPVAPHTALTRSPSTTVQMTSGEIPDPSSMEEMGSGHAKVCETLLQALVPQSGRRTSWPGLQPASISTALSTSMSPISFALTPPRATVEGAPHTTTRASPQLLSPSTLNLFTQPQEAAHHESPPMPAFAPSRGFAAPPAFPPFQGPAAAFQPPTIMRPATTPTDQQRRSPPLSVGGGSYDLNAPLSFEDLDKLTSSLLLEAMQQSPQRGPDHHHQRQQQRRAPQAYQASPLSFV